MADDWRTEADDEWLSGHRSRVYSRLLRRLRLLSRFGAALADAETGPFSGPRRNPRWRMEGPKYSTVRYTQQHIAYTAVRVEPDRCRFCGQELVAVHHVGHATGDATWTPAGAVRACRACQTDSWLFRSGMPAVAKARERDRKVVV